LEVHLPPPHNLLLTTVPEDHISRKCPTISILSLHHRGRSTIPHSIQQLKDPSRFLSSPLASSSLGYSPYQYFQPAVSRGPAASNELH
jgi:hypothetical protein